RKPSGERPGKFRLTKDSLTIAAGDCDRRSEMAKNRPPRRRAPTVEKYSRLTTRESASRARASFAGWPAKRYPVVWSFAVRGILEIAPALTTPGMPRTFEVTLRPGTCSGSPSPESVGCPGSVAAISVNTVLTRRHFRHSPGVGK